MLSLTPEIRCFVLLNLKINAGFFSTTSYNLPQITNLPKHLIHQKITVMVKFKKWGGGMDGFLLYINAPASR